jgi:hypothetical protein
MIVAENSLKKKELFKNLILKRVAYKTAKPLLEPHNERGLKRNWPADLREG